MTVYNAAGVKERHPTSNVRSKCESEIPVNWNTVVLEDIVEATLWAVLTNDGHIGRRVFDCGSNELAQVLMV